MKCGACGEEVPGGAKTCPSCGEAISAGGARPMAAAAAPMNRGKNKLTAALLALLLGGIGVHHFYLGSTTAGIVQICLTVFTCGLGGLLALVEAIMLFAMDDAKFNAKYNQRPPEGMEFVFKNPGKSN